MTSPAPESSTPQCEHGQDKFQCPYKACVETRYAPAPASCSEVVERLAPFTKHSGSPQIADSASGSESSSTATETRPVRIQRRRSKGWKMPPNAVYVGRPTKWGNPYIPESDAERTVAVEEFRQWWMTLTERGYCHDIEELRGKDLACWCPLNQPCHADVLLELANSAQQRINGDAHGK